MSSIVPLLRSPRLGMRRTHPVAAATPGLSGEELRRFHDDGVLSLDAGCGDAALSQLRDVLMDQFDTRAGYAEGNQFDMLGRIEKGANRSSRNCSIPACTPPAFGARRTSCTCSPSPGNCSAPRPGSASTTRSSSAPGPRPRHPGTRTRHITATARSRSTRSASGCRCRTSPRATAACATCQARTAVRCCRTGRSAAIRACMRSSACPPRSMPARRSRCRHGPGRASCTRAAPCMPGCRAAARPNGWSMSSCSAGRPVRAPGLAPLAGSTASTRRRRLERTWRRRGGLVLLALRWLRRVAAQLVASRRWRRSIAPR